MTSGSYAADPQAIASTAQTFDGQVDPIARLAQNLDGIKGAAATTGRDYHAQGTSYHNAVTKTLEGLVREFSEKTAWTAGALDDASGQYTSGDTQASDAIATSGSGVTLV